VLEFISGEILCDDEVDAVSQNTVSCHCANLNADLIAIYWKGWWSHLPGATSLSVLQLLGSLLRRASDMAVLTVDWATVLKYFVCLALANVGCLGVC